MTTANGNTPPSQGTRRVFFLLSVTPCPPDLVGILAADHPSLPGKRILETTHVPLLGVAKVIEEEWEVPFGTTRRETIGRERVPNEVVAVDLCEGAYWILNEADNYMGMCRVWEDPYKHATSLSASNFRMLQTLVREDGSPVERPSRKPSPQPA